MGLLKVLLLLAFVVGAFSEKPDKFTRKKAKNFYSFYNFEKSFCQHGVDGKGKKDGNYAHPKYCERFITCEHFQNPHKESKVTTQYCPYGLFYNEKIGICDWPRNVNCFIYQGKTCFGARNNKFGQVRASHNGYIESLKIIHTKGYVTCLKEDPTYKSFWGCNTENAHLKYLVNTWVTTREDKNGIVFPNKDVILDHYGNYELKGYNQLSPYIKWHADPTDPTKVHRGQQLRVWYGEDLFNINENNNDGRHCVEVYIRYSYYKPLYFLNRGKDL